MFQQSQKYARLRSVRMGMDSQTGSVVETVQEALVMGYIEYESPLTKLALEGDVVELLAKFRQFVFPGTRVDSRLHLAGRAEAWDEYDYKQLIMLFQEALADQKGQDTNPPAPSRAESRKGAKIYYRPPPSCLSRVCGCVTWTINLCVIAGILGLLGFIAMDERRTTVQFWVELVRPPVPVSPVEERLKAMVQETLMQTQMTLEHYNNEKIAEVTQGVGPEVQSLQKMLEEMKPRVQSVQNSLTMTETHLNTLSEEASVMQNEIDRQAKVINESQAVLADLIPSLNATKAECEMIKSDLRYVKVTSDRQMNLTWDRVDEFEDTMRQLMKNKVKEVLTNVSRLVNKTEKETKKRVADLEASTTKQMNAMEQRLADVSYVAKQVLDTTNNALFLPDGGWLLNGYISLTFKSVGLTGLLYFIQWSLVLFKARVNKKTKMHQRLFFWVTSTTWFCDFLLCNLFMCVCVVAAYKTYSMCAAVKNDFTVRCVAYVCGCIMSGLNAVFGN